LNAVEVMNESVVWLENNSEMCGWQVLPKETHRWVSLPFSQQKSKGIDHLLTGS
jgi:hypothetical protein